MKAYIFLWLFGTLAKLCVISFASNLIPNFDTNELNIVNTFSGCLTHMINFRGMNVNFPNINQPVVLLRYFSFADDTLFPFEIRHVIIKGSRSLDFASLGTKRLINSYNKALLDPTKVSTKYFQSLLYVSSKFRSSIKNTNCEANIYLHHSSHKSNPFCTTITTI